MRLFAAFKAFFAVLGGADFPPKIEQPVPVPAPAPLAPPVAPSAPSAPVRSDAITLLAALQREARLVDFLMEPLDGFSDAQVGAAARSVHDDSAKLLKRFFDLKPLLDTPEQSSIDIGKPDAAMYTLTGNVAAGTGPIRGILMHAGWQAGRCELPDYTGRDETVWIVAPAEVEVS